MAKRFPYIVSALLLGGLVLWIFQDSPEDQETQIQTLADGLLPLKVEFLQGPVVEQGGPMLIDFWATWCGPCKATIPHMNQIHANFKDKGLQVIGITREDAKTVSRFTANFPMNYTLASDAEGLYFDSLDITGIPHLVLIDGGGKIAWQGHPLQLSDRKLESLLSEIKTPPSPESS